MYKSAAKFSQGRGSGAILREKMSTRVRNRKQKQDPDPFVRPIDSVAEALKPVILNLARKGIRRPARVAVALNETEYRLPGMKTWTTEYVAKLLAIIYRPPGWGKRVQRLKK